MSNRDREEPREAGQDAALKRAWRDGSTERPSARVDAAILAAAHQAVADQNRAPAAPPARVVQWQRWSRWTPMAAAAAVAGLAFMLVQTLPRDPQRAPPPAAQESAKATALAGAQTTAPAQPDLADRQRVESARSGDSDSPVAQEQTTSPGVTTAPSLDLAPPAAMPADNSAIAAASEGLSVGSNESRGNAAAERGKAAASTASGEIASPEVWVARILSLHDAGDIAAAADALRAFRATEPNADRYLPAQLREWAGSVQ